MDGVADVVVADGFTGNAVLKSIEGTAIGILGQQKGCADGGLKAKLGALLLKDCLQEMRRSLDYSSAGGALWSQGASGQDTQFKRCQGRL